jgi:hypothetical protein
MKKLIFSGLFSLLVTMMISSCSKSDNGSGGVSGSTVADTLRITLSTNTVEFNGFDYASITVKDKTGADVTSTSDIYANGSLVSSKFVPAGTGTYNITAAKGTTPSETKTLNCIAASPSPFSKKIIIEDVTGAWCGFCTRVAYSLENYKATKPNAIVVAVHGGGGTDPYKYQYYTNLNTAFNVTGYPTAIVNRKFKWSESTSDLNSELSKYAPLGLAITSSTDGVNATGKVQVKFNVTTDQPMKIVIALVENGLVYPQVNYYSPSGGYTPYLYGGANPINNFVHNGVMRRASTDIFGDAIPTSAQTKNNIWELNYSIPLTGTTSSGTSFTANSANSAIVAFVMDGSTSQKGVYNAQTTNVGSNKSFD